MKSLSGIGVGLSVVFGCLLLALFAEFYYLLCWKKRITNRTIEEGYNNNPTKELLHIFCCKKPSSLSQTALNPQELSSSGLITDTQLNDSQNQLQQLQVHSNKDILVKPCEEESMETELMRLHKLGGPPRFLFTIVEETKEDLESEDGRSRGEKGSRGRSLSDLLFTVETPFLTPLASPSLFTTPLTSPANTHHNPQGFNPLFESSTDAEFSRIRASPPPKFKFLQDAEEKLRKKMREDCERSVVRHGGHIHHDIQSQRVTDSKSMRDVEEDGSFFTILIDKNRRRKVNNRHHLSPAPTKEVDSFSVNPVHNNACTMNPI